MLAFNVHYDHHTRFHFLAHDIVGSHFILDLFNVLNALTVNFLYHRRHITLSRFYNLCVISLSKDKLFLNLATNCFHSIDNFIFFLFKEVSHESYRFVLILWSYVHFNRIFTFLLVNFNYLSI